MGQIKTFVDTIHGQIVVPEIYCKKIIDTVFFQRLKRLEQTSMRGILPCAHHDRFIHSLGTYHIGMKMFSQIKKTLEERSKESNDPLFGTIASQAFSNDTLYTRPYDAPDNWLVLENTFLLACLLHDCGHAPFSHTFEEYFYKDIEEILKDIEKLILEYLKELKVEISKRKEIASNFSEDIKINPPKKHELVSAWMVLNSKAFRTALYQLHADPIMMARMITGNRYRHLEKDGENKRILNCLISLLNGGEIDADRLDYALRDKWASGVSSATINSLRLISSMTLKKSVSGECVVCFSKQALPDLQVLTETKNYTNFWIFGHHKTCYQQDLLIKAVEKLAILFCGDKNDKLIKSDIDFKEKKRHGIVLPDADESTKRNGLINQKIWEMLNYRNLVEPKLFEFYVGNKKQTEVIYLTSDDDIVHLLKKFFCTELYATKALKSFFEKDNYAKEWFQREQVFIPVWKSYSEFVVNFVFKHKELSYVKMLLDKFAKSPFDKSVLKKQLENENQVFKMRVDLIKLLEEEELGSVNNLKVKIHNLLTFIVWYYEDNLQADYSKALRTVLECIAKDEYCLDYEVSKVIKQTIAIKEINPDIVYVNIDDDLCCYTKLNLPKRSEKKNYNFFYMYAPRIYRKQDDGSKGEEVSRKIYRKYYYLELQQEIAKISHADKVD